MNALRLELSISVLVEQWQRSTALRLLTAWLWCLRGRTIITHFATDLCCGGRQTRDR